MCGTKLDTSYKKRRHSRISIHRGDITTLDVYAIVNPTNEQIKNVAGLARIIEQKAGAGLTRETAPMTCKPGQAKITDGYNLPGQAKIKTNGKVTLIFS